MSKKNDYSKKLCKMLNSLPCDYLDEQDFKHIKEISPQYLFTFQDLKKIIEREL